MPATQRKCINRGLTLDVDRHYIGSVTATIHQEKGIITLESNPSRGTVLPESSFSGLFALFNLRYVGYISGICFCKSSVINGEHIVNISICVDNFVYEAKFFGLKGEIEVPRDVRNSKYYVKAGPIWFNNIQIN